MEKVWSNIKTVLNIIWCWMEAKLNLKAKVSLYEATDISYM